MCETDDKIEAVLPDNIEANHLSTLNRSSLQQLKLSYRCGSNVTSSILLKDAWNSNAKLFNLPAKNIIKSAGSLRRDPENDQSKKWESSLSNINVESVFLKSLPACSKCPTYQSRGYKDFFKSECKCNLGINEPTESSNFKSANSDQSSQESKSGDEKMYKRKFVHQKINRNPDTEKQRHKQNTLMDYRPQNLKESTITEKSIHTESRISEQKYKETKYASEIETIDLDKEEEENRAHKSNVAKITFKTAKETFLASNPAAKRMLGTSRKAQGKFVSPMIGAQEKNEVTEPAITDERLKNIDPKMIELIESEIIDKGTPVSWEEIAGLQLAKSVIQEAVVLPLLRPDIFTGLRRPPKGILLFGPPGTGKTLIGKCVAAQCKATFFSISASSLTSKWIGDGEKMVRALFAVARCHQPAVIFIDEIDSLLTQRSDTEHEATRRIKTEFLVQFDGAAIGEEDRLLIVGATNRPQELDEAARRRLVKRLYIPLPDVDARRQIISNLLKTENNELTSEEVAAIAEQTEGYSGADMKSLCSEAAMGPVRAVPLSQIATIHRDNVRPVCVQDFIDALRRVRPSVSQDDLGQYVKWNQTYGQGF